MDDKTLGLSKNLTKVQRDKDAAFREADRLVSKLEQVCVAVCCGVLLCVVVSCSELHCFREADRCASKLGMMCVAACCSVLQCFIVCCS